MNYPGGKGLSFQKYINLMPPHEVYIESHLGGGAIMRHKRQAKRNIGLEINLDIINKWNATEKLKYELIHSADIVKVAPKITYFWTVLFWIWSDFNKKILPSWSLGI